MHTVPTIQHQQSSKATFTVGALSAHASVHPALTAIFARSLLAKIA
jgi:hypothetical protein